MLSKTLKFISVSALATAILSISSITLADTKQPFKSGVYEQVLLAVTPENTVEGYYFEENTSGPTIKCSFALYSETNKTNLSKIPVMTVSTDSFAGTLEKTVEGIKLTIPEEDHPGCGMLIPPEIKDVGIEYSLTDKKDWIGLVTISSEKAYLRKTPDEKTKGKVYVVKDNTVAVIKYQGDWANVEFINSEAKSYKGWIKKSEYQHLKSDSMDMKKNLLITK